jgi:hypothetical protein
MKDGEIPRKYQQEAAGGLIRSKVKPAGQFEGLSRDVNSLDITISGRIIVSAR